jgi:curved DNA-binding protein CbpA
MTRLARVYHPDTGGSQEQMTRVNAAYDAARASLDDS